MTFENPKIRLIMITKFKKDDQIGTKMKKFNTRQRKAIIEAVDVENHHPTADQIYDDVKKKLPKISLGTIYRNLERMVKEEQIIALDFGNNPRRYETRERPHYHIYCTHCNKVEDLFLDTLSKDIENTGKLAESLGFSVTGHSLEFYGVCGECKSCNRLKKEA